MIIHIIPCIEYVLNRCLKFFFDIKKAPLSRSLFCAHGYPNGIRVWLRSEASHKANRRLAIYARTFFTTTAPAARTATAIITKPSMEVVSPVCGG